MKLVGLLVLGATLAAFSTWSSAGAATITVNAADDIYGAGQSSAPGGGNVPGGVAVTGGETLTFSVPATDKITLNSGGNYNDPDGAGAAVTSSYNSGYGSISGVTLPDAGGLVGVFVASVGPSGMAPPALDFTSSGTSFTSLSPELDQVFFIGDGMTGDGSGATQLFHAPVGASTLYLGISDACGYGGGPGCYTDNFGNYSVTYSATSAVPEPGTWAMMLIGFGGLGLAGYLRSRRKDAAAFSAA